MAIIRPFTALRPKPELAARICAPPYDVLSTEEARAMAAGNPLSFLHVSKAEIDLPPGIDPYSDEVYAKARENFVRLLLEGALQPDPEPHFYLYRQQLGQHVQTGLVAVASCAAYLEGRIRKHELTRPDKENDRLRHIEALNAQTGPAFLVYRANAAIDQCVEEVVARPPEIAFTAPDGVQHSAWTVCSPETARLIQEEFDRVPALYIADGHHRTAAAARVFETRHGAGGSGYFLAVIFPHDQLQVLPYNRLVKDLHGLDAADFLKRLEMVGELTPDAPADPPEPHQVSIFLADRWWGLRFADELLKEPSPADRLDVALLQRHVLEPILGIDNPRTSTRIEFVGGLDSVTQLQTRVRSGEFAVGFSLYPTTVEDLMEVADAGQLMPPKSTWFEPKLLDGMFAHQI